MSAYNSAGDNSAPDPDNRPGVARPAAGGDAPEGGPARPVDREHEVDVLDPGMSRFELVREAARRDGIEIVVYEPRAEPGSRVARRLERTVTGLLLLAGAAGLAFLVAYVWWPWEYDQEGISRFYTPLLGVTLALALFGIGAALVTWAKKLAPHELAVEQRHDGPSGEADQRLMGAMMASAADDSGLRRRPLLKGALTLGLAPIGVAAVAPLVGGLIRDPHDPVHEGADVSPLRSTGFNPAFNDGQSVRLVREDGTPIRPAEVSVGGLLTVFPGIPEGTTNRFPDSPTLLIHLRQEFADQLRENLSETNQGSMAGNFVAYSKICTHAGCPPSLFEQETNRLLCPCHQSQFLVTDNARPVFGPAGRPLPMLPIAVDEEGFFVAVSDYPEPVGPSFWEL